jgi:DNA-binding MurR/RpiR family transcriptional regulator
MDRDLNNRIFALRADLSPQLARLADYLLENESQACFLNARQLAAAAGVSAPSVVRFVRRLGYSGVQSFRGHLQKHAQQRLSGAKAIRVPGKTCGPEGVVETVFKQEILCIERSLQLVRQEDVEGAVKAICRADTVYLLGGKSSFALAYFLYFRLSKLGIDCKLIHPGGPTVFSEMAAINNRDVLLAIGFQLIPREVCLAVKEAKRKKALVVAVTSPPASRISMLADFPLYVDRGPREKNRSMAGCISICTAVVIAVAARMGKRSARIAAQVDALENDGGTYLDDDETRLRRMNKLRRRA